MIKQGDSIAGQTWDKKTEIVPVRLYGALGKNLQLLIPIKYGKVERHSHSQNYFIVHIDDKMEILDLDGEEIVQPIYKYIELFHCSALPYRIAVKFNDGKCGDLQNALPLANSFIPNQFVLYISFPRLSTIIDALLVVIRDKPLKNFRDSMVYHHNDVQKAFLRTY